MTSALVNYYIDANIALLAVFGVWLAVRFVLARFGYRFSFQAEQNLIIAFMGLAIVGPFLARLGAGFLPAMPMLRIGLCLGTSMVALI